MTWMGKGFFVGDIVFEWRRQAKSESFHGGRSNGGKRLPRGKH